MCPSVIPARTRRSRGRGVRPTRTEELRIQESLHCWNGSSRICSCIAALYLKNKKANPTHVIELDIKGCFDNISQDWLLKNIPIHKFILKAWLKQGFIYNDKRLGTGLQATETGIPQGGGNKPDSLQHDPRWVGCLRTRIGTQVVC